MKWMLYATAVASLTGFAALAWDRAAALCRFQSRWGWIAALILSLAIPLLHTLMPIAETERFVMEVVQPQWMYTADSISANFGQSPLVSVAHIAQRSIDGWLTAAWICSSTVAFLAFALGLYAVTQQRQLGSVEVFAGREVVLTEKLGPAVVGLVRPTILLPTWVRHLSSRQRRIVVAHELQHIRARDEWLIAAAICAVIAFPWNAALWWQFKRLRLAIEVDCDQRVLRSAFNPTEYGQLLIDAAAQQTRTAAIAAALIESKSSLETRIKAMFRPEPAQKGLMVSVLAFASAAICATAAAVNPPALRPLAQQLADGTNQRTPRVLSPRAELGEQMGSLAAVIEHFEPGALIADRAKTSLILLVVNGDGRVANHYSETRPSWQVTQMSKDQLADVFFESMNKPTSATPMFFQLSVPSSSGGVKPEVVIVGVDPTATPLDQGSPRIDLAAIRRERSWVEAHLISKTRNERAIIELADPAAIDVGLDKGMELWIMLTEEGEFIRGGRRAVISDPNASQRFVEKLSPTFLVTDVARGTAVRDARGNRIPVSWHWVQSSGFAKTSRSIESVASSASAENKIAVDAENISTREVIGMIARKGNLNVLVSDKVNGNITVHLKAVTSREALDLVSQSQGLIARQNGGVTFVDVGQ
ncbi:MAG TPA: M56 family metallopeptidase [Steroidobacteraceae bacterium]|nr:M56 family metallopeptidase [Steroidobacteraceae bacterium]